MPKVTAVLLARCVDDVRSGRLTLEACLAAHPAEAEELRPLLDIALAIKPPPPVELDETFRLRTRTALIQMISHC